MFLTFLWQLGIILVASRLMGRLFARLGQPQVVGEMVAGIVLGPSVFGLLAPGTWAAVFPPASLTYLHILSQVGVVLFLFLIGVDLDPRLLQKQGRAAIGIGALSILLPFALGAALTGYLYPRLFGDPPAMQLATVSLFIGAAMSVTAFPVLARILTERNLHRTSVGALAIVCAAMNDVIAWCMLAFVVAICRASGLHSAGLTAILATGYVLIMFWVGRPLMDRLEAYYKLRGRLSQGMFGLVMLLIVASALATEAIGIHALFGAFIVGVIMPKGSAFVRDLTERLEDITVVFLLPIFFAFAGLQTQIGLLSSGRLWIDTALIVLAACAGKIGGASIAARVCGLSWRESSAIGILMNTRGLMELVILNIGRELGVISDVVFAMMVIMALVTTALTTPVLSWVYPDRLFRERPVVVPTADRPWSLLVSIARPDSATGLLRLGWQIAGSAGKLIALHLKPAVDRDAYRSAADREDEEEDSAVAPLAAAANEAGIELEPLSLVTTDVATDIVGVAAARQADFLLMGFHRPIFGQTLLGGTVHKVMSRAACDIGVFVDRGFTTAGRVLVPFLGGTHDRLALELARRLARSAGAVVTVLHVTPRTRRNAPPLGAHGAVDKVFADPTQPTPVTFRMVEDDSPIDAVIREAASHDLVLIGVAEKWGLESHVFGWKAERIAADCPCSMLIVRKGSVDAS